MLPQCSKNKEEKVVVRISIRIQAKERCSESVLSSVELPRYIHKLTCKFLDSQPGPSLNY